MKKKLICTLTGLSILFASNVYAGGLWSMAKNAGLEKLGSKAYVIDVVGVDIRAYVFKVPEMKSVCISVWGENSQQLECKTYKELGM